MKSSQKEPEAWNHKIRWALHKYLGIPFVYPKDPLDEKTDKEMVRPFLEVVDELVRSELAARDQVWKKKIEGMRKVKVHGRVSCQDDIGFCHCEYYEYNKTVDRFNAAIDEAVSEKGDK